jgi:hypothetical protein
MFYIGSSSIKKVENGYFGSVSSKKYKNIFLKEKKNNPSLFKIRIISIHKTRKDALIKENSLQKQLNVVSSPMYINQSYATEFGMPNVGQNNGFYGKKHTKQTKSKLSKPRSEETKFKMRKPKSQQHKLNMKGCKNWQFRDYSIKETCIYCGIKAMKTNITRFHNDNCKLKTN